MRVILEESTKSLGLIVGHSIIGGLDNKKNRSKPMERLVKELETEVKENPRKFLDKKGIMEYERLNHATQSAILSDSSAPRILVNLILQQGRLPTISRIVDCMNIVSIKFGLTISIWDLNKIKGDVIYKLSKGGEQYWPFMGEEVDLLPGELINVDNEKVLGLVRFRDSKYAPVTLETKNILVHIQGVGAVTREDVDDALNELEGLLLENVGGITNEKRIIAN